MQVPPFTFFGKSTLRLTCGDATLLTDPILGNRWCGESRTPPMAMHSDLLLPLTAILLTSAHPGHCERQSFRFIPSTIPIIAPVGVAGYVHPFFGNPIIELAHFAPLTLGSLTITALPARYRGGRGFWSCRFRGANSYLVQWTDPTHGPQSLYVSGKTAYGTHFREASRVAHIDTAFLPLPSAMPQWWAARRALTVPSFFQAAQDLGAQAVVPIHWGFNTHAMVEQRILEQLQHAAPSGLTLHRPTVIATSTHA